MLNPEPIWQRNRSATTIYWIAAAVFLVTAWFSTGYNHFDEHYQVIEFAGLKLGLTEKANLPWEYGCMMRPAVQPFIVYCIYKAFSLAGITNPFVIAWIIRLFSAGLTFFSIHLTIRLFAPRLIDRRMLLAFLLLSFFLWFVPYNAARFSSETVSGRIFLIGIVLYLLRKNPGSSDHLVAGLLLGLSFIIRYQTAFMVLGFGAWLLFIRRANIRHLAAFAGGFLVMTGAGILIDRWFYDQWVLTSWNYFYQNMVLDKAATFGISPWWYYIEQTFMNAFPPLSLVLIMGVFLYFFLFPKDPVTWIFVPFLAAHFYIPHKEIRFLFPIIGFLPVMIMLSTDRLLEMKGFGWLDKKGIRITVRTMWYLNLVMLAVLMFRPADDHIALYKTLWNEYDRPARLCYTDDYPYRRAKVDAWFYKRKSLVFSRVDSAGAIRPAGDTAILFAVNKPVVPVNPRYEIIPVYTSFPSWVRRFNFNHWIERTSFWYVYEMKPKQNTFLPLETQ